MENQLIEWSAAVEALDGEPVSGDLYLVRPFPNGVLVAAVDGLGHGPEAAASAQVAISTLEASPEQDLMILFQNCHEALRTMRGVVMSLASFHETEKTMSWLGVGNVEGRLFRANQPSSNVRENLLLRGGIVGHNLPTLITITVPIHSGDTLIFASDGIRSDFAQYLDVNTPPQKMVSEIVARSAKNTDDSLVVVARYI